MFFFQKIFFNVSTNIYIIYNIYDIYNIYICDIYIIYMCMFFSEHCFNIIFLIHIFRNMFISFPSLFLCFLLVWSCFCLLNFMHVIGDSQFVCALCWLYFLMLAALQQCFGSAVAQHDLLVLLVLCVWVCHGVSDRGRGRTGFEGCKRLRV